MDGKKAKIRGRTEDLMSKWEENYREKKSKKKKI